MRTTRLIAPLAAAACAAAFAVPATAAAGPVGNYSGYAVHESLPDWAPLDTEPFEFRLVMRISKHRGGTRLTALVATIRKFCSTPMVDDVRIVKMDFRGPRVSANGSFSYRVKGISFSGRAHNGVLEGTASGGNDECGVEGVKFRLKRVRGLNV
ncbi:MAG TPA: hypothetical protein VF587_19125 [Solirubrobacteraceae bacterium]|jgi:hypothetical protein